MNRSPKAAILAAALWAAPLYPALAQSSPGWTYGQVPTTAQWNAEWASKQDYLGAAPLLVTGGTMTGPLVTAAPTTSSAGFNLAPGTAPTSPNNGDLWVTAAGIFIRINGSTYQISTGGAVINPGSANEIAYYSGTSTISGISAVNNAVLVTNGSGAPSESTTLPSGIAAANMSLTTPSLGVAAGTSLALGGATIGTNALAIAGTESIASAAASALAVGPNGATNPVLNVDGSIASSATGLGIQGRAAGSAVALFAISSATNETISLNAKGSGTVNIGNASTGGVQIGQGGGGINFFGPYTLSSIGTGTCANGLGITSGGTLITDACPGAASSVQPGTTTITGTCSSGQVLYDNAGVLSCVTVAQGTGITLSGTANLNIALSTITGPGVLGSKTNGAGQAVTTVQTPVLLETLTPSGSASFASSVSWAGYSSIKLRLVNLTFSTALNLIALVHSGGAYQATAYSGGVTYTQANSGSTGAFGTTTASLTTGIYVTTTGLSSSAFQVGGDIELLNITGSQYKQVTGRMTANNGTSAAYVVWPAAAWTGSGTVDGIQFNTSTGTVSGLIEIWGIP